MSAAQKGKPSASSAPGPAQEVPPKRAGKRSARSVARAKVELAYRKRYLPFPDCSETPDLLSEESKSTPISYAALMDKCKFLRSLPASKGNIIWNQMQSGNQPDLQEMVRHFTESSLEDRTWSSDNWWLEANREAPAEWWPEADRLTTRISKNLCWVCRHSGYCNEDGGVPMLLCYSIFLSQFKWKVSFLFWMSMIIAACSNMTHIARSE